jgi:hypothetical protein
MKLYLGDGVYVEEDVRGLVLTTQNGVLVSNVIVLEPAVYDNLVRFVAGREAAYAAQREARQQLAPTEESSR